MSDVHKIAAYYDHCVQEEYLRLTRPPVQEELILTIDLLNEYIPPDSRVIDIGAGPGRYAEYLIQEKNCKVALIDISEESLKDFKKRLPHRYHENIILIQKSSATDLRFIADASFDYALLMGPLYHLTEKAEREQAIRESRRILKPNGLIFASFISPYMVIPRFLNRGISLIENPEVVADVIDHGIIDPVLSDFIDQFRCWPHQAKAMMEAEGFETLRIRNMEGVGTFFRDQQREDLDTPARKEAWLNILRKTCENPDLLGATIHFLYVGKK